MHETISTPSRAKIRKELDELFELHETSPDIEMAFLQRLIEILAQDPQWEDPWQARMQIFVDHLEDALQWAQEE